ncbi:MAG: imidazole glycerol phosphate synthase subunit HisF [Candidatus Ancillula sp.]|jgi:cyclase|nr:imidazole glycerol phosphate synthase subunit HisF [Candidatus Ancillula sp.]
MLKRRVIPCLDVKDGKVVKGVNFQGLKNVGDPVELAKRYYEEGADELTFLDVSASIEGRGTMLEIVERTANQVFIPLTVGGGVRSVEDVRTLLNAGADKIGVNSSAVKRPDLISEISAAFGRQVVVLSADARRADASWAPSGFEVTVKGGTVSAKRDLLEWVRLAEKLGAGEVLLNSMDKDGTKSGFDLEMINLLRAESSLPLIASGGAGKLDHFREVFDETECDAVLAASVFHNGEVSIYDVKHLLA